MTTESHLTIRDYFDHMLLGSTANKKPFSSAQADASATGTFRRILTSFGNQRLKPNNLKPSGLTVEDYRSNSTRIKGQFNQLLASASFEKKFASAAKSAIHPELLPDQEPAGKTTATPPLKRTDLDATDSSASLSSSNQTGLDETQIIERSIHVAARKYDLPPNLIKGVIRAESNFQVDAVSRAGAQGLMQLMPGTAKELGVENPFDIEENIDGGACYLRKMMDSFGGDLKVALAAYNAGPGAVQKYGGEIPPYQETERYINRVLKFSKQIA
jgi:soluble lytic murein transglycosylase-like protein